MRTFLILATAVALLAGSAGLAQAEDFDPRAAIDAALVAPPADTRLVRRVDADPEVWAIGGAPACGGCGDCPACEGPWRFRLGVAFSLAKGNSDKLDLVVDGKAIYERPPWLWKNKAEFVYGESDGVRSTEAWHTEHKVERQISGRVYAFVKATFDRDELAELEYRINALAGFGYTFIKNARTSFKGEIGGGMVFEKRLAMVETQDPAAYVGLEYEHTFANDSKISAQYDFVPNLSDFDLSVMTWDFEYTLPVCDQLDLTIGLRIDYVFEPPPPAESVDVLLAVGIRVRL